jgi:hypothetical protein
MSSKQSETPRRGVGTDIGGGKWTISNTTKGTTGCNCALFQSTCKTPISGKHCLRRASGKIQTLGAFTGTASSTTWQMEKMRRAFSPLYESLLPPPALRECLHDLLARRGVAVWALGGGLSRRKEQMARVDMAEGQRLRGRQAACATDSARSD